MKCPHLIKWALYSCEALARPYWPSIFEIEEYCMRKTHRRCPFYLKQLTSRDSTVMPSSGGAKGGMHVTSW